MIYVVGAHHKIEFPSKKRGAGVCIKKALENIKGNVKKIENKHTP
jgi:hypothetical protein